MEAQLLKALYGSVRIYANSTRTVSPKAVNTRNDEGT